MNDLVEQEVSLDGCREKPDPVAEPAVDESSERRFVRVRKLATSLGTWPAALSTQMQKLVVSILAVLVVAGAGGLGYVWITANSATAAAEAGPAALASARSGIPALLSYDYRSIDTEFQKTAESMLTGKFLAEYSELGSSVIRPAAKKDEIVTKAEVVDSALVSSEADSATVLLFVNQTTTSKGAEGPRLDGSRIRVQLVRDGSRWMVSEFIPV